METAEYNGEIEELIEELKKFSCFRDVEIQRFLTEKAFEFIEEKICNVFLIVDENAFNHGLLKIEAYFTLSHRAVILNETVSKTRRKRITGFKDRTAMEFVLVGQIGKYMKQNEEGVYISNISLEEIIRYIELTIRDADKIIPCNFAMIECSDELHEKRIYDKVGFNYLQKDKGLHQYYKALN